jgi:hypothetical protein
MLDDMQTIVCRFMTNDAGEYLPFEQAYSIFDELSQEEAESAVSKFTAAYQDATIPNEQGRLSVSTSEVVSPTPPNSLNGSTS